MRSHRFRARAEYTVTETSPTQANYKSTSFSVNGGAVQSGLSATVSVTDAASVAFTNTYEVVMAEAAHIMTITET